jgi:site-specific recombinase XerD
MNKKRWNYKVKRQDAENLMNYHLRGLIGHKRHTPQLHARVLESLLMFLTQRRTNLLSFHGENLVNWMKMDSKAKKAGYCASRFQVVDRYIERLCIAELLPDNPLRKLKPRYKSPSWYAIAEILQSKNWRRELRQLCPPAIKSGPLRTHINEYIKLQQSLGKEYLNISSTLNDLDHNLERFGITKANTIKPDHIRNWLGQYTCSKPIVMVRAYAAKRFMAYLMGIGVIRSNPVTIIIHEYGRIPCTQFQPFIFTKDQIVRILNKAKQLMPNHIFKLRPQTSYMMLVLLYALGLRNREVRYLRFRDIDMNQSTIRVEATKFHKSRLLPFGKGVKKCLKEYMAVRSKIFLPIMPDDPLFITYCRKPMSASTLSSLLKLLAKDAICENVSLPRIHDIRHTFAVHRLLRWYREGADVQLKLPLLSVFMGHTEVESTEVYLTITMELLKEANNRFYHYCGKGLQL